MTSHIAELDLVEVSEDLRGGLVEGARGTVLAVHEGTCTVEFVDAGGLTIGLFEIPSDKLERVDRIGFGASVARED